MAPRPRGSGNRDLPPNVEINRRGDTTYYRYVMPDGKRHSLGKDKQQAIEAGLALNSTLSRNPDIVSRLLERAREAEKERLAVPHMGYVIEEYSKRLAQKRYADSSRANLRQMLAEYDNRWASRQVDSMTVLDVASLLNGKTAHSYIKHRILLIDLFAFCTHQGWIPDNPAAKTMEAIVPEKQRQRHTLEALMRIREASPDYLQRAIDLALHSVQRRGDLVRLQRTAVNIPANTMTVLQEKSRNYAKPVFIEIDMHPELQAAVIACISTPLAFKCPYLLHYKPKRMTRQAREGKPHHLAMTEGFLSKEFAKYRDGSGVYADLRPEQRPSLHDIRALGIKLVSEKYGQAYAMALAGHADERMWRHYLDGHEEPKPVKVSFR